MLDCAQSNKEPGVDMRGREWSRKHKGKEEIPPVGLGEIFLKR